MTFGGAYQVNGSHYPIASEAEYQTSGNPLAIGATGGSSHITGTMVLRRPEGVLTLAITVRADDSSESCSVTGTAVHGAA